MMDINSFGKNGDLLTVHNNDDNKIITYKEIIDNFKDFFKIMGEDVVQGIENNISQLQLELQKCFAILHNPIEKKYNYSYKPLLEKLILPVYNFPSIGYFEPEQNFIKCGVYGNYAETGALANNQLLPRKYFAPIEGIYDLTSLAIGSEQDGDYCKFLIPKLTITTESGKSIIFDETAYGEVILGISIRCGDSFSWYDGTDYQPYYPLNTNISNDLPEFTLSEHNEGWLLSDKDAVFFRIKVDGHIVYRYTDDNESTVNFNNWYLTSGPEQYNRFEIGKEILIGLDSFKKTFLSDYKTESAPTFIIQPSNLHINDINEIRMVFDPDSPEYLNKFMLVSEYAVMSDIRLVVTYVTTDGYQQEMRWDISQGSKKGYNSHERPNNWETWISTTLQCGESDTNQDSYYKYQFLDDTLPWM